jgi:hypothetical protein
MSMGKRVTSTLGLLVAVGLVGLAASACAPTHDPNNEGPPTVVKAIAYFPDDPTVMSMLYVTNDPMLVSNCEFDYDAGTGPMDAFTGTGWGFRIVLSELIDGDQVEPIGDSGVGEQAYPGFVQITTPEGGTVTSTLDPTLQLTPDTLFTVYQPSGGSGCFGTIDVPEPSTGASTAAPAIIATLGGVSSLPSNTALTLWLKKENDGHKIVDTGGTEMAADFSVSFTTDPMLVDCADITACNTLPSVNPADQPQDPNDPDVGFDMVTVQLNTTIGDPNGVYLYEMTGDPATATLVPDVVADVDANIPDSLWGGMDTAVSLTGGIDPATEAYIGLTFTPDGTYWIVVTDAVKDLWGVPVELTETVDENGDPLDLCGDAVAAGVTLPTGETCVWAGSFTIAPAA